MDLLLFNQSDQSAVVQVEEIRCLISPMNRCIISIPDKTELQLTIEHNYQSTVNKFHSRRVYHLVFNLIFDLKDITDGDELYIFHFLNKLDDRVYSYKFSIKCNSEKSGYESQIITKKDELIKIFKQRQKLNLISDFLLEFFISPIFFGGCGLAIIAFILSHVFDYKIVLLILVIIFILIYVVGKSLEHVVSKLFKKKFNIKTDKEEKRQKEDEFYSYLR